MPLQHHKILILMNATVPERLMADQLSVGLSKLTNVLTDFVTAYETEQSLGYYPALDYLMQNHVLPGELCDLYESSCQIASYTAKIIMQNKLKAAFSQVHPLEMHHTAYNIPAVHPHDDDMRQKLNRHYLPNSLHIKLELSQIQKDVVSPDYEQFARRLVYRWLSDSFEDIEITASGFEQD